MMCPDGLLENNKFELIYDEFYEGYTLSGIMQSVDNKLSCKQIFYIIKHISFLIFIFIFLCSGSDILDC